MRRRRRGPMRALRRFVNDYAGHIGIAIAVVVIVVIVTVPALLLLWLTPLPAWLVVPLAVAGVVIITALVARSLKRMPLPM